MIVASFLDKLSFFYSSLLILYEGLHKENPKPTDRMRHFSKRDSFGDDDLEDFEDVDDACHHHDHDDDDDCHHGPAQEDLVTVKIIDFAHATFEGFLADPIVHIGPDAGFLKGLDTLLDILTTSQAVS